MVGDARTGWTNAFNVIYEPIRMYYQNRLPIIPGSRSTTIDTVPVDYVGDAIHYLSGLGKEVEGKTFHLSVGARARNLFVETGAAGPAIFQRTPGCFPKALPEAAAPDPSGCWQFAWGGALKY